MEVNLNSSVTNIFVSYFSVIFVMDFWDVTLELSKTSFACLQEAFQLGL